MKKEVLSHKIKYVPNPCLEGALFHIERQKRIIKALSFGIAVLILVIACLMTR